MGLKARPLPETKAAQEKHIANPASFQEVLKTYGLTQKDFNKVKAYVEKHLGHALAK